jgi:SAM-dependent methyltransferase
MLAEHLSQDHDLASRRTEFIDRQVEWIHNGLLKGRPVSILDLGCGPGFYSHRLTMLGHGCRGIDFAPASIDYARLHNPDKSRCRFVLADIRRAAFGGPYDLAMILFGEFNVFSQAEARAILQSVQASLNPRGALIIEAHTPEVVESMGRSEPSQQRLHSGLFSDRPHLCRTESKWLAEQKVAIQTFHITEAGGAPPKKFHSTTKAWTDPELTALLKDAGFDEVAPCDNWPCNTPDLKLWIARRQKL